MKSDEPTYEVDGGGGESGSMSLCRETGVDSALSSSFLSGDIAGGGVSVSSSVLLRPVMFLDLRSAFAISSVF